MTGPSSTTPPDVPQGDPAGQAIASLRGYAYQLFTTARAWLSLGDGEELFLEVAQDYATAARDALAAVQVKDTQSSTTIHSQSVRQLIAEFVDLVERNPARRVTLRYLSTAAIGKEQKTDHRVGEEPALAYWVRVAERKADVAPLREVLMRLDIGDKAHAYIKARDDTQLRDELIARIAWDCGQPPIDAVKRELEAEIGRYAKERLGIPEEEGQKLFAAIVLHLLKKAIEPAADRRKLTAGDLSSLLDTASRVSLRRADVDLLIKTGADAVRVASTPPDGTARQFSATLPDIARDALERDLTARYRRALMRAPFPEASKADPFQPLANEIFNGGMAVVSSELRRRILLRAARSAALRADLTSADSYLEAALKLPGAESDRPAQARIAEARGNPEEAIRTLRDATDAECRSTLFSILSRARGDDAALAWLDQQHIDPPSLTYNGVIAVCNAHLKKGNHETARAILGALNPALLDDCPYLLLLRGAISFACLLPKPDQPIPLMGLQLDVRRVQPVLPDADVAIALDAAAQDFHRLIPAANALDLREVTRLAEDYLVWFDLVHPIHRDRALQRLRSDMAEPGKALGRIQFAFAYDVSFDPAPIARYLERREVFGGLNEEELRAAFLVAIHTSEPAQVAAFIGKHGAALDAAFGREVVRLVEVQALARAHDATGARAALAEITGALEPADFARLNAEIAAAEGGDPVVEFKQAYDTNPSAANLRALVASLAQRNDYRSIAPYAEKLFALTDDLRDLVYAVSAYARSGDNEAFIRVVEAHPEVLERDASLLRHYGWQLFERGRFQHAETIAYRLKAKAAARDLNLEIAIAIETGEWESLSDPLSEFLKNADNFSGLVLIRAAHLSHASGQGPTSDLVSAAIVKGENDPHVLLGAYTIRIEEGLEDQKSHEWFRRALALSGVDGPIQQFELRDILAKQAEWNKQTIFIQEGIKRGDIHLAVGASGLHTTLIDIVLRNFTRNSALTDARRHVIIPVFSGRRDAARIGDVKRLAIDLSALLVLGWLGLLPRVLEAFAEVVIPSGTLFELFEGRRRIREYQKSRVQQAGRIHRAIAIGKLKLTRSSAPRSDPLVAEVGDELAALLRAAAASDGAVLRPAPVIKPGVEMHDADVSAHAQRLTDMHSLLEVLKSAGVIDQATETTAKSYFRMQDRGWPASIRPNVQRPLYVDRLALVYLDTVNLLDAVLNTFANIYIDASTADDASALLEHDKNTGEVLRIVDEIRDAIRKANAKNKVIFAPRRVKEDDREFDLSTLNLLANPMQADAIVFDDRALNKEPFVQDRRQNRTKTLTTLDLIEGFHAQGIIPDEERRSLRHRLRKAGAGLMPVDAEEIALAALRSGDAPSAELKAIRESLLLARVAELPGFPSEIPWFAGATLAVKNAVVIVWQRESDPVRAAALSNTVLDLHMQPEDWLAHWEGSPPPNWVETIRTVIAAALALPFELNDVNKLGAYNTWLEQQVLEPLRIQSPKAHAAVIEYIRGILDAMLEDDDD